MSFIIVITCVTLIYLSSAAHFLWPSWGGSISNQQRPPDSTPIYINENNINELNETCKYQSMDSITMYGFIAVYKDDNSNEYSGVFCDFSGNIININLDTCAENWKRNITELVGGTNDDIYVSRNGLSLFRLSDGTEGVLFGTPNGGNVAAFSQKYAVALTLETGDLMWTLPLGNTTREAHGMVHSFMVDGDYAYGGMSAACQLWTNQLDACKFVGRMYKIRMSATDAQIVDVWYSISEDKWPPLNPPFDRNYYQGAAIWNWPAIIDDYLIFGTGNLYTMPTYVEKCIMEGENLPNNNAAPYDPCGVDQSANYPQWRCLEDGVYPSAFNILNKNGDNLSQVRSIVLQGIDVFCGTGPDCTLGNLAFQSGTWSELCYPVRCSGADADLAAVAAYRYQSELYGAGIAKSGMFYSFKIPSGELFLAKKIGPWSELGGGQFSFAVSEEYMIGIAHITGGFGSYYSTLADDNIYCGGVIHAIDLTNGKTLYQIPNPWAYTGAQCASQPFGDNNVPISNYEDYSEINSGLCEKGDFDDEDPKVIHIDISHLQENKTENVEAKATFFATVTIANNLLFIPSATGDIFIHNLQTGEAIHIIRCDYQPVIFNQYGRRGLRAGVTVVEDRIIYYCGDSSNIFLPNGVVHSLQIRSQSKK